MNRLKTFIIVVLHTSIVPLYANVSDELEKIKTKLLATKQEVHMAAQEVEATHTKIQEQLLNTVNNALDNSIRPQARTIKNNVDEVDGTAKEIGLFVLGAANPIKELRWMLDNPIKTITETLESTQATFTALNNKIDPAQDPEGIFADLKESEESFDKTIKNLQDAIAILKAVGL